MLALVPTVLTGRLASGNLEHGGGGIQNIEEGCLSEVAKLVMGWCRMRCRRANETVDGLSRARAGGSRLDFGLFIVK
jgi:hypothetical protein